MTGISRRSIVAAPLLLTACSAAAVPATSEADAMPDAKTLVAFFTRSGNTKVIAGTIQRALGADLFEIKAAQPYPEDYEATVERARIERDRGETPDLAEEVPNFGQYKTVYLAFPIWGETTPPMIRSFLRRHDLTDKRIFPVITHGGYGLGNSLAVLKMHAPNAHVEPPFVMVADQERRTLTQVSTWLKDSGAA